jgi:hypothetical protein
MNRKNGSNPIKKGGRKEGFLLGKIKENRASTIKKKFSKRGKFLYHFGDMAEW